MSLSFTERCPSCGAAWDLRPELLGEQRTGFAGCAFRCEACGICFSNARNPLARVRITRDAADNVPVEARAGLGDALDGAVNVGNRTVKRQKFCSANSEDAVTWTVVAGLREAASVGALLGDASRAAPDALLLWGHPVAGARAEELRQGLIAVSDGLHEQPDHRTEPDVMVLWPDVLVMIEAKHGSSNDRQKATHGGWDKYLLDPELFTADAAEIRARGAYQLVRNWVIGARLARDLGVDLRLVNLGPEYVGMSAAAFGAQLRERPGRRFEHRSWQQVLSEATLPTWLVQYGKQLGLA